MFIKHAIRVAALTMAFGLGAIASVTGNAGEDPDGKKDEKSATIALKAIPATVAVGGQAQLQLELNVGKEWHLYGRTGGDIGQAAMRLSMKLPAGLEPIGEWEWAQAQLLGGFELYKKGRHVFRHRVKVTGTIKGPVRVDLAFQACTDTWCELPKVLQATAVITQR